MAERPRSPAVSVTDQRRKEHALIFTLSIHRPSELWLRRRLRTQLGKALRWDDSIASAKNNLKMLRLSQASAKEVISAVVASQQGMLFFSLRLLMRRVSVFSYTPSTIRPSKVLNVLATSLAGLPDTPRKKTTLQIPA